jgi:hypothetical protein
MFSGRDGYFSHDDDEGVTVIGCTSACSPSTRDQEGTRYFRRQLLTEEHREETVVPRGILASKTRTSAAWALSSSACPQVCDDELGGDSEAAALCSGNTHAIVFWIKHCRFLLAHS